MYQLDWANRDGWDADAGEVRSYASHLPARDVAQTVLLNWHEHCVECAAPGCYATCPLYVARSDRHCARLVYGIYPNRAFEGAMPYGADVRFRRWGKLETLLDLNRALSIRAQRGLDRLDRLGVATAKLASAVAAPFESRRTPSRAYGALRRRITSSAGSGSVLPDAFVIECFSGEAEAFNLILECVVAGKVIFRHAFELQPGHNFQTLSASALPAELRSEPALLRVFPSDDREARLVFTWLDFVTYAVRPEEKVPRPAEPAPKVKCVAWDLDGTLWDGVLIEDGREGCRLREEVVDVIRALDARGILQTVVSKNDPDEALGYLRELELDEYFLHPAVSWGPKSDALIGVSNRLGLGLDTFAFVDDTPFEREEVLHAIPEVRVYDAADVRRLLELPEFDVPVTAEARARRESYRTEETRLQFREGHHGDYDDFLRSCELELRIFTPHDSTALDRCYELVQRSNQLNLSARRLSRDEIDALVTEGGVGVFALDCRDRFGVYGIVGFAVVDDTAETPALRDFVLSCRVLGKGVEHAFLAWLAGELRASGKTELRANLVPTPRNAPIQAVFEGLGFQTGESSDAWGIELGELAAQDVVRVVAPTYAT